MTAFPLKDAGFHVTGSLRSLDSISRLSISASYESNLAGCLSLSTYSNRCQANCLVGDASARETMWGPPNQEMSVSMSRRID